MPRGTSTKGRQRVPMIRMANESNLQVTFSKRRSGLFKKASEIATLCGAEVAIIVFSPGHKAFSFGYPGVKEIVDRYLNRGSTPPSNATNQLVEAHRNACVRDLNIQLANVEAMLEVERQRGIVLDHARALSGSRGQCLWKASLHELNLDALVELEGAMEGLKINVEKKIQKLKLEQQQIPSANFPQGSMSSFGGGGSGSFGGGSGGGSSSLEGGGGTDVFSLPLTPNSFGAVAGAPSFPTWPKFSGRGGGHGSTPKFSTGSSSFGGSTTIGNALPFSTGKEFFGAGGGNGSVLPISRGTSSSFGGGGALQFSTTWSSTSTYSVGGSSRTTISGSLPFPSDGNVFPVLPPGPSSFGQGGALSFPSGPSYFGSGSGNGSGVDGADRVGGGF